MTVRRVSRLNFTAQASLISLVACFLIGFQPSSGMASSLINGCDPSGTNYPSATNNSGFGGGKGLTNDPWLICSRVQLAAIGTNTATLAAAYALRTDIDLASAPWTPIVMRSSAGFSGIFNGGYFSISNATISGELNNASNHFFASAAGDLYGLFAHVSGTVRNLEIRGFRVTSDAATGVGDAGGRLPMAGALAGSLGAATIERIRIVDSQVGGNAASLGLVAGQEDSGATIDLIDASSSDNRVTPTQNARATYAGGLVGRAQSTGFLAKRSVVGGQIGNSSQSSTTDIYLGGIVGYGVYTSIDQVIVTAEIRAGNTTGAKEVGGIMGIAENHKMGLTFSVRDSVFAGSITAHEAITNIHSYGGVGGIGDNDVDILRALVLGEMPQTGTAVRPIVGQGFRTITEAYYNSDILTVFRDASRSGAKTQAELQDARLSTGLFSSWSIAASGSAAVTSSWAFDPGTPTWRIAASNYPSLVWRDFWPAKLVVPSNVLSSSPSAGSASITWSASTGAAVSGYRVQSSTDSGNTWTTAILDSGSSTTSASLTGLTPGASYSFRVLGISAAAFPSDYSAATTPLLMGSNPGSPENLAALNLSTNSFRVSWDPPSNTGGLSITSYTLQVDKGGGYETVAHTGTSAEITGVSINSLWSFRVLATNVVGSSSFAVYTNTPPVPYSGPIVTSFSTREVVADRVSSVTLDGMRLSQVTELFIGNSKLSFTRSANDQLVVSLPALAKGVYDLRMVYSGGGVITHQAAFTVVDAPTVLPSRTLLFTNFAGDGFRLPAAASRGIRSAVSSLGSASKIVCVGSTSGTRATVNDGRLALRRAQEACNLAQRLVPGVVTEVRANPASGIGARFRSVSITISGN